MTNQSEKLTEQKKTRGGRFQILGGTFLVIGIVILIWGFFEIPMNQWLGLDFLSFAFSGMILITSGLAICKAPSFLTIVTILISVLILALYIWAAAMGMGMTILSYIIAAAITIWLISLTLK
ncbi:hypothetical protein [Oceanobacillus jeddahense]|uniref:hypothetical protein n=1 Tax=Oceanobacillus jeddahense TaxID=1462527 RepID=UPI000595BFF5|nr:hypothetical protein [Oceanobacillus jeddahense]